jgi:predicted dehydrogenase
MTASRRRFLASAGAFAFLPSRVLGRSGALTPNEKLNLAFIGIGGRGSENLRELAAHNVVALCDVDWRPIHDPDWPRAAEVASRYPGAKRFTDFRRMLEEMDRSIDAVVISTPDHTHAVAAIAAMDLGKHVYCEKPLAHSVGEVRAMMRKARESKVATQMGNQGHSSEDIRLIVEWIRDGAIGTVKEVHIAGRSAQAIGRESKRKLIEERHPVPQGFNWDLWLGPRPYRPFHPIYHPVEWRNWLAFGGGTIADFTCHYLDAVYWALDLRLPAAISARTSATYDPRENTETFPDSSTVRYEFSFRGGRLPVTWYADQELPRPEGWDPEFTLPEAGGIVIGSGGALVFGFVNRSRPTKATPGLVRLYPEELDRSYKRPPRAIPRTRGHWNDWIESSKTGKPAGSHFDYGGPLTEVALLGNIAIRRKGRLLRFDPERMRFTNDEQANKLLQPPPYREGWSP